MSTRKHGQINKVKSIVNICKLAVSVAPFVGLLRLNRLLFGPSAKLAVGPARFGSCGRFRKATETSEFFSILLKLFVHNADSKPSLSGLQDKFMPRFARSFGRFAKLSYVCGVHLLESSMSYVAIY